MLERDFALMPTKRAATVSPHLALAFFRGWRTFFFGLAQSNYGTEVELIAARRRDSLGSQHFRFDVSSRGVQRIYGGSSSMTCTIEAMVHRGVLLDGVRCLSVAFESSRFDNVSL